ncbi:polyhydroxyalkanoate synthesis repressor PhaR [Qipengyuania sp. DGS5-3]|uniref:polyhydroxyalkanoate synthesis repressor PhaR n=1 Tax=Qipengyuania sp. DGS5-3 TaxID=3349632 RepID=UPI0036D2F999
MAKNRKEGDPIIVKKYANRRLYNTDTSSYITLDDLAEMVRSNTDFEVFDAKSGDDITHSILTQIIVEQEASGKQMLPVSFLRDLISMYGNSMQNMMPSYLEASMANFRQNREELTKAFKSGISNNPLAKIHETNMAMMRAATEAFIPSKDDAQEDTGEDELAALRTQMAEMQKKLDALDK